MSDSCSFYLGMEYAGRSWVIIHLKEKKKDKHCLTYLRARAQKDWASPGQDGTAAEKRSLAPTQKETTRSPGRISQTR